MELCQKLIQLNPKLIIPYEIMDKIYEKNNDFKRMFIIKLIAADLKQTDTLSWIECARLAAMPEINNLNQAKKCYNRALKQLSPLKDMKTILKLKLEKFRLYILSKEYACIVAQSLILIQQLQDKLDHDYSNHREQSRADFTVLLHDDGLNDDNNCFNLSCCSQNSVEEFPDILTKYKS